MECDNYVIANKYIANSNFSCSLFIYSYRHFFSSIDYFTVEQLNLYILSVLPLCNSHKRSAWFRCQHFSGERFCYLCAVFLSRSSRPKSNWFLSTIQTWATITMNSDDTSLSREEKGTSKMNSNNNKGKNHIGNNLNWNSMRVENLFECWCIFLLVFFFFILVNFLGDVVVVVVIRFLWYLISLLIYFVTSIRFFVYWLVFLRCVVCIVHLQIAFDGIDSVEASSASEIG